MPRRLPRYAALSMGIATAIACASAAGQEAAEVREQAPTTLDRIQVTGSRILVPGLETSSPVMSVERDDFLRTQPAAVEEFVRQLPSMVPAMGPGTNNGTGGAAEIDLRGLGSNRTLVLIDSRRPVPYDLFGVVDTNTIPLALLQSVDILTGGASVVYGADAISGVANFLLRRDFEGVEVTSSYGQSGHGDGSRLRNELTMGANLADGRGNVVLSVGHTKIDPVFQGDRSFGATGFSSTTGAVQGSGTTVPSQILGPPGVWGAPDDDGVRSGAGQIDPETGLIVDGIQTYNFNPDNYFQTGLDRYQATALGYYEFNRHAEAYAELRYIRSRLDSLSAPSGLFLESLDIPIGNPFIPEPARQQLCQAYGIAADECVAGSQTLVPSLTIGRRMTELGPRFNDFDTKTFQVTAGLRGDIGDSWRYDGYWSHGESDQLQVRRNWGSLSKTQQALLAVDRDTCLDTSNGCVPLDIWGPEGSITPEMVDFINLSAFLGQKVKQTNAAFNLSGDLGDSGAPWTDLPIGVATGVEYRKMTASTFADAASQIDSEVLGTGASTPDREGSLSLKEAYAEIIVPIVSDRPGVYSLSLEAGYRHSEFSTSAGAGDDYGSFKYGLEWAPIESLRFRGMFQRATRAPNIDELFQPAVTGLDNLDVDPCGGSAVNQAEANTPGTLSNLCRLTGVPADRIGSVPQPSAGQVNVLSAGNPELAPELADTQTLGLVWAPRDDFALTFDYWRIEVEDAITSPEVDDVLKGCYDTAVNPNLELNDFCALIGRSPVNGTFNGASAPGIGLEVTNQGVLKRAGFDLGIRYGLQLPRHYGRLNFSLDTTRVTRNRQQATPASIDRDCLGYYSISCTPSPKFKSILRTTWSLDDLALSLNWRYTSALEVEPDSGDWFEPYTRIPAYSYFDLSASYKAPFGADVSLAVNNLLDKKPPIVGNTIGATAENSGNTFPQFYDAIGRYVTLGVTFRFD
ncbi:TonB-dependent receptor domain-containing protein [Luteimonas salinilitoris]|uniref:TonB-dependent receptor n=1 Tax=Luteimonas salinilitoris TaxID=3237697 RepID=A0ABV4HR04_9GAMM